MNDPELTLAWLGWQANPASRDRVIDLEVELRRVAEATDSTPSLVHKAMARWDRER